MDHLTGDAPRLAQLRDELWRALSSKVDGIGRHTPDGASLPKTLLVSCPGVLGAYLRARAPELTASTGSACHAGQHTPNATLFAMGVAPDVALGAMRLSSCRGSTRGEIEAAAELLAGAHRSLVATQPPPANPSTRKGTPR
jgi:cysteine desulfurase